MGREKRLSASMQCFIYKGDRKRDTYLYITMDGDFSKVPESLLVMLGTLEKVMDLTLDETKKLANADTKIVLEQLNDQGFYLQMPPSDDKLFTLKASLT